MSRRFRPDAHSASVVLAVLRAGLEIAAPTPPQHAPVLIAPGAGTSYVHGLIATFAPSIFPGSSDGTVEAAAMITMLAPLGALPSASRPPPTIAPPGRCQCCHAAYDVPRDAMGEVRYPGRDCHRR